MPTNSGYISPDEIIAEATELVMDTAMRRFSYGNYLSQVQRALAELAFDTYFDDRAAEFEIPDTLVIDVNSIGMVSLERIFVFNGECTPDNIQPVWYARGFTRFRGAGFKQQKGTGNGNPIMDDVYSHGASTLYYSIIDGQIMLSDACSAYAKVMLRYRGMGCKLGDKPIVPNELREAVTNYVAIKQVTKLLSEDPSRWSTVLANLKRDQYGNGGLDVGAWQQAKRRVQAVDIKEKEDVSNYLSVLSLNY